MITLLPQEIETLNSLKMEGDVAGNYADAYRYLSGIVQAQSGTDHE